MTIYCTDVSIVHAIVYMHMLLRHAESGDYYADMYMCMYMYRLCTDGHVYMYVYMYMHVEVSIILET